MKLVPGCIMRHYIISRFLSCLCRRMRLLMITLLTCLLANRHYKRRQLWKQQKEEFMLLYVTNVASFCWINTWLHLNSSQNQSCPMHASQSIYLVNYRFVSVVYWQWRANNSHGQIWCIFQAPKAQLQVQIQNLQIQKQLKYSGVEYSGQIPELQKDTWVQVSHSTSLWLELSAYYASF